MVVKVLSSTNWENLNNKLMTKILRFFLSLKNLKSEKSIDMN